MSGFIKCIIACSAVSLVICHQCNSPSTSTLHLKLKHKNSLMIECHHEPLSFQHQIDDAAVVISHDLNRTVTMAYNKTMTIQKTLSDSTLGAGIEVPSNPRLLHEIKNYMMMQNLAELHSAYNCSLNARFIVDLMLRDTVKRAEQGHCYHAYSRFLADIERLDKWLTQIACSLRSLSSILQPLETQRTRLWPHDPVTRNLRHLLNCQRSSDLVEPNSCLWRDFHGLEVVRDFLREMQHQFEHIVIKNKVSTILPERRE